MGPDKTVNFSQILSRSAVARQMAALYEELEGEDWANGDAEALLNAERPGVPNCVEDTLTGAQ